MTRCLPTPVLGAIVALGLFMSPTGAQGQDYAAEIQRLAALPAVQRAMDLIEATDERTMQDLRELTQIPAPPFMEAARGARFREMLEEAGADSTWVDEEGNVIGLRRGTVGDQVIAVSGHLDTVFPEGTDLTIHERGDTLLAPGISDDTRGLAANLAMLRAMNGAQVETASDILFIGTVGEEGLGDLRGVKHLFREGGPQIDAFISIDGTTADRITHQALGSYRYRVTIRGPGGHSWNDFGLANPQHALGHAIAYFDVAADAITREGPRTSYNVGRIGGGTSINSVPFDAWMEIDMRSESPESLDRMDAVFQRAMRRAVDEQNAVRREGEALTLELDMIGLRPSGEIPASDPFVQRAVAATRHLGMEPDLYRSSTDANIPISMGIPSFTTGGGGVNGNTHSLDEWFVNEDGPLGIQRALLILVAQAGIPGVS